MVCNFILYSGEKRDKHGAHCHICRIPKIVIASINTHRRAAQVSGFSMLLTERLPSGKMEKLRCFLTWFRNTVYLAYWVWPLFLPLWDILSSLPFCVLLLCPHNATYYTFILFSFIFTTLTIHSLILIASTLKNFLSKQMPLCSVNIFHNW